MKIGYFQHIEQSPENRLNAREFHLISLREAIEVCSE
jgi:hypothetical protein